ncbi:TrmH family RNA methyltransferase [Salegentibacter sp. HM20]
MQQLTHSSSIFSEKQFPIVLFLDNITGAANLGSLFRLADAFNIQRIIFTGTPPDLNSNRLKKTARSTQNTVAYEYFENSEEALKNLKNQDYEIYALEITENSIPVEEFTYKASNKIALVPGNENYGVDEDLLKLCDKSLHINMYGKNSSMNVAQATGIALYEITKSILAFHKK